MADTLFVVGRKGHIWHRSDTGVWTNHNIGAMSTNDHFYGIHGLSNNEVYAVGFTGTSSISTCWYYKWNGSTWSVWTDAPSLAAGYGPTAIYCFASDSIFLTYTNGSSSTAGGILYWNGSTWSTIDSGSYKPYNIWGTAANNVYFGCRIPGACEIKKWNGSSIANSSSVGGGDHINNLYGSSDGTLFACGEYPFTNGIWKGVWDTLSATVVANIKCNALSAIYGWNNIFSNNGKAWAFGYAYLNNDHPIVAVYDGSWATSELKNQRYSNSIAIAGISDSELIAIYGDSSAANIPPNDAAAFIWDGSTWSEEGIGDGGTFGPTDAWASSIPTVDTDPPEWANLLPNDGDTNVTPTTTISLDIIDPDSGIDEDSVDISVEGVYAWHNNTEQTGFSVVKTAITDGFNYSITPDTAFELEQVVDIDVYAEDLAGTPNVLDDSYSFTVLGTDTVTLFVVGQYGGIWHRTLGGTWSDQTPAGLGTSHTFWSVWGVNANEVYAIGKNTSTGAPLWYKWDGTTWDVWSNPPTIESGYTPIHIFGLSSDLIWIIADKFGTPPSRIYQWDGSSWSTIYTTDRHRYGTFAPDAANLYAVGATGYSPPSLFKYLSGTSWTSDSSITEDSIYSIYGSNGVLFCTETDDYVWRGTFNSMTRDYIGDITFKYDVDGHGVSSSIWSINGKCWVPSIPYGGGVGPYCRVAIYNGSSWSIETLSAYNCGTYRALTGTSENDIAFVAGTLSPTSGVAYIWNGVSWVYESMGITYVGPMGAWAYGPLSVADPDPPEWANLSPDDTDVNVPIDTTISLDIIDPGSGVDENSVDISVEGVYAWHNNAEQTGFSVVKTTITDGFRYVITPDTSFSSFQTVDIDVYAEDLASTPNVLDDSYYFRTVDLDDPVWANLSPNAGDTHVAVDTTISIDILDYGDGVDANTVDISVEGVYAWHNDAEQTGFSVVKTSITNGYRYVITPDTAFDPYQTVDIDVYAEDLAPTSNVLDNSYYFVTADTDPPEWANLSPDSGDIDVSLTTTISLDILDYDAGVDVDSVYIKVEGVYAWLNDTEQTGFSVVKTSITDGYRYVITPDSSFTSYQTVDIDVYAEDLDSIPNVLNDSYNFRTVDVEAPVWDNLSPDEDDINVPVDTTISLDILDYGYNVDENSVDISVEGVYAWHNNAEQTGFSVVKTTIANGYRYVITPDSSLPAYTYIDIDVYAEDLAPTPNVLNDSYSFRTADSDAPVWDNLVPNDSDINVPVDTTISLDILDYGTGIDADSVYIKVEGAYAWLNDAEQTGFSVVKTSITDGYRYVITPDTSFSSYQTVDIDVYAEDLETTPNVLNDSYSFRIVDIEAPYLANQDPAPDDTGISPLTSVYLDVLDDGDPVDASSVIITIDGTIAWQSDALQNGYTGSKTSQPKGYRYTLTPPSPLPMLTLIEVNVQASDTAPTPNSLDTTYSFTTTTDIPPEIRNMDPANGAVDVAADKKIEFDTWDNVAIDESETVIVINSVLAYQNSSGQNSFTVTATPIVDGYHYEVTAPTNWARGTIVSVQVQVYDTLGVPATVSWSFEIYGAPDCFTGPINSFEASLLVPYDMAATKLYRTEILRNLLLNRINTYSDPIKAIRQIYLCAFNHELAPILREIVPTPTPREKTAKLCYKRTIIQVDTVLRSKPNLLRATLAELQSIGLPVPHSRMLNRYLATDEPNTLVPLACIIVILAKALEANALS